MKQEATRILGFQEMIQQLADSARSEKAKQKLYQLAPILNEGELRKSMRDTTEARKMIDEVGLPPLPSTTQVEAYMIKTDKGELLRPEEIEQIGIFLNSVKQMKRYLEKGQRLQLSAAYFGEELTVLEELKAEIDRCIRNGEIDDYASDQLNDIRKALRQAEEKTKEKAEAMLRSNKRYMAESFLVNRNGRVCLPVKAEHKAKIQGSTVDKSSTGSTVFIEPETVARLREEREFLQIEEDNEERRILYIFMSMIDEQKYVFQTNLETLEALDFMFAKGKLSADMKAVEPAINTDGILMLKAARHPALKQDSCVPLNIEFGGAHRGIVITGPNTGGKTVAIKTAGLLTMMAASGLHVPCEEANICMRNQVLCDIGDGQNIEDNLSTFSAHIRNVLDILKRVTADSLVILDELGSGTDPAEGMGIAVAILEQLRLSGCLFLVTTHYPEVKTYAEEYDEILNARMAFDRENLKPLYRLEMGKAGESCALYIAERLGMPGFMLDHAARRAYGEGEGTEKKSSGKSADAQWSKLPAPSLTKLSTKSQVNKKIDTFGTGDSVTLLPGKEVGIVVKPADQRGNVLVQTKEEKKLINHKRLKLLIKASELYPEDYDFSIVFDSVELRKARHQMERKYQKGIAIDLSDSRG